MEEIYENEMLGEEADIKDILTSEEKKGLTARDKSFSAKLELIMEKHGTQDRLELDKLESEITAKVESMESLIENLQRGINIKMSELKLLEKPSGYKDIIDNSPEIKNVIGSLKTIIAGMIQQIQYLNISLEYLNAEKTAVVEKLKTNKNSEVVLQVIEKQEQLYKQSFENMEKMYMRQINSLQAQLDKAHGITLNVSESSLSEKEIGLAKKLLKPKTPPRTPKPTVPTEEEETEETEEDAEQEKSEKEKFSNF